RTRRARPVTRRRPRPMTIPPLLTPEEFSEGTGGQIAVGDPRVKPLLDGATRAVRRYCHWHVAPVVSETIVLDGEGGSLLMLPTLRVQSIEAVRVNGTALDVDDLEWSEKGMVRRRRWPNRFRSIEVTF